MSPNENARAAGPTAMPGAKLTTHTTDCTPTKPLRKRVRVLKALLTGRSLNRFEAARDPAVADSCLNSSVAEFEGEGVRIDRVDEVVPGRHGPARVKRYTLHRSPENVALVRALLGVHADDLQEVR